MLFGDQRIPEASSCKYLGRILGSDLRWADQVNYTVQKAWKALHFIIRVLNLLEPNDVYICRTAGLNSRRYILNIYSTNIHTEYCKHAA